MKKFTAHLVEAFVEEFDEDYAVFNLLFEESDPDLGGESWNFQRALGADGTLESLGEDDDGVCIVKEIQQLTDYEKLEFVEITKNRFYCKFSAEWARKIKIDGLDISYEIDDAKWKVLLHIANLVFLNRNYYHLK